MDELYFVQSFAELKDLTELDDKRLKEVLEGLITKGWVRCMKDREGEPLASLTNFDQQYSTYCFLATKAGLLAHNSR